MIKSKSMLIGSAIAAVMASSAAMAGGHVASQGGTLTDGLTNNAYIAATVGIADVGLNDDAVIGSVVYGKDLGGYLQNLSAEVEFTGTLADGESDLMGTTIEASYMSAGVYAVYSYDVGTHVGIHGLDLFGKAGVAYNDYEVSSPIVTVDGSDFDLGFGVGVNYNLKALTGTDSLGVRAEWADNGAADEVKVGLSYVF